MTPLEALWAAADETQANAARADAWNALEYPIIAGSITILDCTVDLPIVEFHGIGGTLDWPLRLINAPIGRPDPNGNETHPDGETWTTDPLGVLLSALEPYQ